MDRMQFSFVYDGQEILWGESNELAEVIEIPSGGWSDDIPFDSTDPDSEKAWVNRVSATPVVESPLPNYARIPTDITLEDSGYGVELSCEHHGIRLIFKLTHTGDNHYVTIYDFQKKMEDQSWKSFWNLGSPGSMTMSWNSDSTHQEEGYLAIYEGYVIDKYGQGGLIPSIGFQLVKRRLGVYTGISATTYWETNLFNPLPDPSHSYEPNNTVLIGGTGSGAYPYSNAENPNVSLRNTYMSFGSPTGKGLTYYITEIDDLMKAYNKIYSFSYINEEARLSAMVDAFKIPNLSVEGQNVQHFWIADINVDVNHAYIMTTRFTQVDLGSVDLSHYGWDDYNDFKNTRASLLLPFVGRINIDIHAIARGALRVTAVLDRYTGNVAYWVYTTGMQSPREVLYGVYEGQSAIQIPFGSAHGVNQGGKLFNMATSFAGLVVGASSGNPVVTLGAGFAFGKSIASSFEVAVDKAHMDSSSSAATGAFQVRLDIERREMLRPEQYREIASIPSFITVPLGQLTGFVSVHSTDCRGLTCEEEEKNAIKELLMKGVIV